uniref:ATP synthase F0 subunit 8 n=1 Tax=Trigonopterus sp. 3 AH-2016 TaxID=1903837 RepID=A0A343C401_9CUCU|nr:ATP synthase F0 subunit 8 [Trigonopterus sp. 3 AH-2016]
MPQMAPVNWTLLYILIIFLFLFLNWSNFFNWLMKLKFFQTTKKPKDSPWKW